jgi:hypothetical protein
MPQAFIDHHNSGLTYMSQLDIVFGKLGKVPRAPDERYL